MSTSNGTRASEIARAMTLFETDEALEILIASAADQMAEADGQISDELRTAFTDYVEAFGEKVDRIANYIKAQEAFADAAKNEAARLEARRKSAENRVKACKAFLCWFMTCRSQKHLEGRLNTFTLASNSVESLIVDNMATIAAAFQTVSISLPRSEWEEALSLLPRGSIRERLETLSKSGVCINRTRLADALRAGQEIPRRTPASGQHVRLT